MINNKDILFMNEALKEAKKAYKKDEVPIGAIIVKDDKIIARGHNLKEIKKDSTLHAEIIAIKKASKKLNSWRLDGTKIYITLEPCPMCAGAIIQARINEIIYAANDPKSGACGSKINLFETKFNHQVIVRNNVLTEESSKLLKSFFKTKR